MWRYNIASRQPEKLPGDGEEASTSADEQPTCFDTTDFGKFLDVCKNKLTVRYTGNGLHDNDVGSIQANRKVPRKQLVYYYEMTIIDGGDRNLMAIGFAEKGFKMGRHPGWEPNSYGYHAEDGKKLTGVIAPARNNGGEEYGPTYTQGDTVGAGIFLERQEIFFTKNGKNLGTAFRNVLKLPLYPTIGLHSRNEQIEVNFGVDRPFVFDLEALVQEERSRREAAVQSVQVPSGVSHQIVRDYLLHYGYANTLRSFVSSAGLSSTESASSSSSVSRQPSADDTLQLRSSLREKFMKGQVDEACKLLEHSQYRHFLGSSSDSMLSRMDVYFYIKCLAFVELIRNGRIDQAVDFARRVLSPLRGVFASRSSAHDAMLADVVALLAYVAPEASPIRALLESGQREAVADMVNAAVLEDSAGSDASCRPQAILEKLLMQVVAVQEELHTANGGHGQVFRLLDHLMSPTLRAPHIANGATANGVSGHSNTANGTSNGVAHME